MNGDQGPPASPGTVTPDHRPGAAREEILRRVRHALSDVPAADESPITRSYDRSLRVGEPADLFAERAADYQATVRRIEVRALPSAVARILRGREARRIAVPAGVPGRWLSSAPVEVVSDDPPLTADRLDRVDGVLTGCAVAIALTGTIVLDGGVGQGRRTLTLVPDYHLCVVRTDQIVGTVPEAVAALDPSRPLTWISGPSATSDIELSRVEGVHGPRTLDILIVG